MFRKVLIFENALAKEHPALQRAIQLASFGATEFKVVDIVEDACDIVTTHRKMRSIVHQERMDRLESICQVLREQGIPYSTELIRGRPFVEIVREVVSERFDLVIKTASLSASRQVTGMMGPVDMRMVRSCPCPVWLENTGCELLCRKVLVAIDPQAQFDDLSYTLLKVGRSLAKASGAILQIVSAWTVKDEEFLIQKLSEERITRYLADVEESADRRLHALLSRSGNGIKASEIRLKKGEPAEVILKCIEQEKPDILVIGTVNNNGLSDLLVGNTAYTVLRNVGCSVVAIKPQSLFRV